MSDLMHSETGMSATAHMMELQRQLGFSGSDVDGRRGRKTTAAILAAADAGRLTVAAPLVVIKPAEPSDIPAAGVEKLRGIQNELVGVIHETATRCDIPFTVIEGLRTAARQAQLVAQGASKTSNSRHLTGHAVDLWPLDPVTGKPLPSDAAFARGSAEAKAASARLWSDLRKIAAAAKAAARDRGVQLEWGGDWGWDAPHFQLNRKAYPA